MDITQTTDIKVVINNRNRYATTKNMVEKLLLLNPEEKIIIIDNESTYEPLLLWYKEIESYVDVRHSRNEGHLALWVNKLHNELSEYFVYTDSDIQLNDNFPSDWKQIMFNYLLKYPDYIKVALALDIQGIPDCYAYKNQVIRNEGRWWLTQIEPHVYDADTDTTFFLMKNTGDNTYKSLRLAHSNMISKHIPWYIDINNLDEEEKYYLENHSDRFNTQYTKQHKYPERFSQD